MFIWKNTPTTTTTSPLKCIYKGEVSTPFRSPPQPVWDLTIHPFQVFVLLHNRDGISQSTRLQGFVLLPNRGGILQSTHTPKGVSFSFPTDVGTHNPPPFTASFSSPTDVGYHKFTPLQGFVLLPNQGGISQSIPLQGFVLLPNRGGISQSTYTPKGVSFSSPTDVGSHNSPPQGFILLPNVRSHNSPRSGPSVLWHSFLSPINVGPLTNPPLWSQRPYWHTTSCLPLRGTTSSLAHCPVSNSDTICNSSSPPLTDIVFFRLSLSGLHPYKERFVLLPTDVESHTFL